MRSGSTHLRAASDNLLGTLQLLVLKTLAHGPKHGFAITLHIQTVSDRIMFSTDHPYASMADARAFSDKLPVSSTDQEEAAHETRKVSLDSESPRL